MDYITLFETYIKKMLDMYRPAKQTLLLLNNKELELWLKEVLSHKNYMHIIQNTYIIAKNDTAYLTVYRTVFTYANDKQNKKDIINIINNTQIRCTLKEFDEKQMLDAVIKILVKLGMKFDYIVMNPPYSRTLHFQFFQKFFEYLNNTGKMYIVEPSTWLINVRKNKLYDSFKKQISKYITEIIIENFNEDFLTNNYVPFSVTMLDKANTNNLIKYSIFGETNTTHNIFDVNLIGDYELIWSIFNKINIDKVKNHIYYPNKSTKIEHNYYIKYADIIVGVSGFGCNGFDFKRNPRKLTMDEVNNILNSQCFTSNHNNLYYSPLYHRYKNKISEIPLHKYDKGKHETEYEDRCITGTKQELENWIYFVFNNSLPLFINIVTTIDQHNNSLNYVPWLVDKKYTDEEIYKMFNFTKKEIELIENTIKKYNKNSKWYKRYISGPRLFA